MLREFAEQGHCFVPLVTLKRNAAAILGVEEDPVEAAVDKLAAAGKLVLQEVGDGEVKQVFLEELYHAERRVAAALRNLLATPSSLQGEKIAGPWNNSAGTSRGVIDLASPELFGPSTVTLDEDQVRATQQALREKVLVITGGPWNRQDDSLNCAANYSSTGQSILCLGGANGARGKADDRERRRRSDDDPPACWNTILVKAAFREAKTIRCKSIS